MIRHFTYFDLTDDVITMKSETTNEQKLFYDTIQSIYFSKKCHFDFGQFWCLPGQAYKFPKVDVEKKVFLANISKI